MSRLTQSQWSLFLLSCILHTCILYIFVSAFVISCDQLYVYPHFSFSKCVHHIFSLLLIYLSYTFMMHSSLQTCHTLPAYHYLCPCDFRKTQYHHCTLPSFPLLQQVDGADANERSSARWVACAISITTSIMLTIVFSSPPLHHQFGSDE